MHRTGLTTLALLALGLAACGGPGADGAVEPPTVTPAVDDAAAYRFLNQATFGATPAAAGQL
ncbi:MAG: hypothetical protein U5K76_12760 [Woeseiaceae bacterium]|nr:hypothetical protein [Woeseiaceae bacterium]